MPQVLRPTRIKNAPAHTSRSSTSRARNHGLGLRCSETTSASHQPATVSCSPALSFSRGTVAMGTRLQTRNCMGLPESALSMSLLVVKPID